MKGKKGMEEEFAVWVIIALVILGLVIGAIIMIKKGKLDSVPAFLKGLFRFGGSESGVA